jgi:hypothetical protein
LADIADAVPILSMSTEEISAFTRHTRALVTASEPYCIPDRSENPSDWSSTNDVMDAIWDTLVQDEAVLDLSELPQGLVMDTMAEGGGVYGQCPICISYAWMHRLWHNQ